MRPRRLSRIDLVVGWYAAGRQTKGRMGVDS